MFYLIDRKIVAQIVEEKFPLAETNDIYWIEQEAGWANVGDSYVNGIVYPAPSNKPTIEERRNISLNTLLLKRNEENTKNITIGTDSYFADQDSVNLMNQTLASHERGIENVFPANWILADGTTKAVAYEDLKALNAALVTRISANFANYYSLYMYIAQSDDPENVNIDEGWAA